MVLIASGLCLENADKLILDDAYLNINEHNKIGIIGVNGVGKSSLLKILSGKMEAEKGEVIKEKTTKIAYLPQNVEVKDTDKTIFDYIREEFKDYKASEFENIDVLVKANLYKLGIFDFNKKMYNLSGGEKRRVMLGVILSKDCDLLVLDEPTNHLDNEMASWLEKYLIKYNKAILMVTHDRYFLNNVCNMIIELSGGKLSSYSANYEKYLELKNEILIQNEAINRKRRSFLNKEIDWIRRGALARTTKDKRRIENYDIELEKYKEANAKESSLDLSFSYTNRLGNIIIEADNVSKEYDGKIVLKDFSYKINEDDRIGIVGKNGAGKSTLLNMLSLKEKPSAGEIRQGLTVKLGYFTQENEDFDKEVKVIDYISERGDRVYASKILENFLFTKEMQQCLVSKLSGGEKRRLRLLKVLAKSPNVLFLDEPTNDLDIETLNVLEEYINSFKGPVLIVSHDRYFLDKVSSKILEILDDGKYNFYNGNYSDYILKRKDEDKENIKEIRTVKVKKESNKLTYKEKMEFETILDEIDEKENELKMIEAKINEMYVSSDAYKNYKELKELEDKKEKISKEIEYKMERWEYLSSKE